MSYDIELVDPITKEVITIDSPHFMGGGTTCKMAVLNNRNYLGIEISQEYCDIACKRIYEHKVV